LRDESDVSYHAIVGPKGERRDILPFTEWKKLSAWSVGVAKAPAGFPENLTLANHATINLAFAGGPPIGLTDAAFEQGVAIGVEVFQLMEWGVSDLWRVLGHADLAVYGPTHPKAGQYGRKTDPWGMAWLARDMLVAALRRRLTPSGS